MECASARLTVYFEDPFWVGVYEREEDGALSACKITFGAEPRDCEVYSLLLTDWRRLEFGPAVEAGKRKRPEANPKRARRRAAEQTGGTGVGTKAQQALQLQREQYKLERRRDRRDRDKAEEERQFRLRQEKRKAKRRGH